MNHLLIAGGTGFIGYHLAYKLKQKGWKITSLSITKPKKKRIVKGVKYLLVDLTKKKLIKQKLSENYTHVINLSGHTSNLYSKKYKKKIYNSHYLGTKNLINFFLKKKIKSFIQIGSSAEYGNAKNPQNEKNLCEPTNIYGKAKFMATKYTIKTVSTHKFPANVLRLFQVYGPHQGENRAVTQLLKYCISNHNFPASDGKQIRDFCYIDDVIKAIYLLLRKNISGKIINIGSGNGITMKKLILTIQKVAKGGKPKFGLFKSRSHENTKLVPSIILAKKLINWKPTTKLIDGLNKTRLFIIKNGK
jgi:nucleoside-diphosphate-sugar epimerase|tara:strand:+ start:91 stop:1002 length:912 start_codon:yes stop_codon:yes gene_type:complete